MGVHVCVYVCGWLCACICRCAGMCGYACVCTCMGGCVHACVCMHAWVCMHVWVRMWVCMCVGGCVHACACACTRVCAHVCDGGGGKLKLDSQMDRLSKKHQLKLWVTAYSDTQGRIVKDSGEGRPSQQWRVKLCMRPCTLCGRKLPRVRNCELTAVAHGLAGWSGAGLEDPTVRRRLG